MKQLIICSKDAKFSNALLSKIASLPDEPYLCIASLDGSTTLTEKADITYPFTIVYWRGKDKMPINIPEVDNKSLTVEKGIYQEGKTFTAKITVPTTEKGKHYTVILAKHGVVFHERNRWTYTSMAKGTTAADVAKDITEQINANTQTSGVKASYVGGAITVTAVKEGDDFSLIGADELTGVKPTDVTVGRVAMLDKAYVQDLASRCAAGKGFNYTDNPEIYPGYPEVVDSDKYDMFTLRFAVPRVAAKQRDEVVYQIVHIAVPENNTAVISALEGLFDTAAVPDIESVNE